jgi:lantibiotic modifying enzyme
VSFTRSQVLEKMHTYAAAETRPWRLLLDRDHRQQVLASIHEIEVALVSPLKERDPASSCNVHLAEGTAGIALFLAYLQTSGFAATRELALDCLVPAVGALSTQPMTASLYGGFTGIAWAVQHLDTLFGNSSDDVGCDIDLALEAYLGRSPWPHDYDLISGLVGLGVYCLERANSPLAGRCLELIVDRLSELAEPSGQGLRWHTRPNLLPPQQRRNYPQGNYNLGLAHGVPGIIALLGRIYAAGISREKTGRLLEGAVYWLLQQRLPHDDQSSFFSVHVPGARPEICRLAWCYGDAGVAAALFRAARSVGEKSWEREALTIAHRAAARDGQSCGVVDACFCHGSSGLAHIFNRLYQATHDEVFAAAARYWIERTLQFCNPGDSPAGYRVKSVDSRGNIGLQARYGILEGIAGIGLSLLAATSAVEPCWDRIFLLDIPPLSPS